LRSVGFLAIHIVKYVFRNRASTNSAVYFWQLLYLTPADKLAGRQAAIFQKRDQKLAAASELRRQRRAEAVKTDAVAESHKPPASCRMLAHRT